ncbi:MAG: hypothetical protein IIB53_03985 [Planctomycetes bacterium]|nr:hypothetical protein [Planctomycetota bacterium]
MASEAKRGLIRIVSNYARVISNVVLGLLLVPMLLQVAGNDGWALIALLGSTIGLASMAQDIVRSSLIRELGTAYHSGDGSTGTDLFRHVYNSALAISAVIAGLAVVVFAVLWFVVPLLDISNDLLPAAQWLVVAKGAETVAVLLLAAPFNMYKVTERMVAFNAWQIATRSSYIIAAAWLLLVHGPGDPGRIVTYYAFISSALVITVLTIAVAVIMFSDRRLIPALSFVTRSAIKAILHVGGWNAAASAATMLYRRLAPVLMNLASGLMSLPSGLFGVLILALSIQVTVSVRRLTMGMTDGLDAVSTRLSMTADASAIRALMHHSTRLHGVAAFPLAIIILLVPEILLRLWLGGRIDDPQTTLPLAVTLIQIMTLGMVARAVSDGWIRILYGAGHVRRYAWIIIAGAVIYPLVFGVLLVILPTASRYTAVTWAYSAVLVIVHGLLVPLAGARALRIRYADFFVPLVRPLIIAVVCSPILLLAHGKQGQSELLWLIAALALYGVTYLGLCIAFVMNQVERRRFTKAALRRLPFRRPSKTDDMH